MRRKTDCHFPLLYLSSENSEKIFFPCSQTFLEDVSDSGCAAVGKQVGKSFLDRNRKEGEQPSKPRSISVKVYQNTQCGFEPNPITRIEKSGHNRQKSLHFVLNAI